MLGQRRQRLSLLRRVAFVFFAVRLMTIVQSYTLASRPEANRLLRSWAGLCDLSPDYSPILGATEVEGFHVSAGWGTYGFKAAPIVGQTLAELVEVRVDLASPHGRQCHQGELRVHPGQQSFDGRVHHGRSAFSHLVTPGRG